MPLSGFYCIAISSADSRSRRMTGKSFMQDALPHGGLIRKLWIGEAEIYRDHLLRLDADSRRSRFAGAVSDEFVQDYADLSFGIDAVIHGFFVDGILRGAAELRPIGAP